MATERERGIGAARVRAFCHDLRNALSVIFNGAEFIAEELPEDASDLIRESLEDLVAAAEQAEELVRRLADEARRVDLAPAGGGALAPTAPTPDEVPMPADIEQLCANIVRGLAIDAIERARSGHPGMPLGMADVATALWGHVLRFDPSRPDWPDRDRLVLSAGHGSMLLYALLHLTGTALTLDDLRRFRQWGSPTAGHPEHGLVPGVETTTGPLGQGLANAVGMAMAERWLRERFGPELVDHRTWVIVGDGCLMEGIGYEAASLAGHLGLGRLVVLYDDNRITIDGPTSLAFSEDVPARFRAAGWRVLEVDGHDRVAVRQALEEARASEERPTLVRCRTTIGFGSPHLAGSERTHGAPLGPEEARATKAALGLDPDAEFQVPDEVYAWFRRRNEALRAEREAWERRLAAHPLREEWERLHAPPDPDAVEWPAFEPGAQLATRKAGHAVLQAVARAVPNLVGGSADLTGSNGVRIEGAPALERGSFRGRNVHFGIREHAMAAACNGMALHGGIVPFCATFLVFHDYMRPAVRLAALMRLPVVFVYTHDSVHVGEDGPTHQPVEQLESMRLVPGLHVWRPADAAETVEAWRAALARRDGPTAICLTRQGVPVLDRGGALAGAEGARRGGYVLAEAPGGAPEVVLVATGSEVHLALEARARLAEGGVAARVVSLPCRERFEAQDVAWRDAVLPPGVPRVVVEAGATAGWRDLAGPGGEVVGIDRFGASAPGAEVAWRLGLTAEAVAEAARRAIGRG